MFQGLAIDLPSFLVFHRLFLALRDINQNDPMHCQRPVVDDEKS